MKRLVAATPHATVRDSVNAPAGSAAVAEERLLLTPSLRVEEANDDAPLSDDAAERHALEMPPEDDEDLAALTAEGHSLEDRIAELEAAVSTRSDEFEPDGSELVDHETPRRFVFQHTPVDLTTAPPPPRQNLADRFDPVDEVEAAITNAPEPESAAADATPSTPPDSPDPEPIPLRLDVTAPDAEAFAPSDAQPEPQTAAEPPSDATPSGVDVADDIEIDEDMLRDIVADIVRSELQGELGERITRNVRKLVRREIHRAIMTRDFS
ncbi:MAG: hypothetical protein AAFQ79_18060 [Pseudomonadota bacterium]